MFKNTITKNGKREMLTNVSEKKNPKNTVLKYLRSYTWVTYKFYDITEIYWFLLLNKFHAKLKKNKNFENFVNFENFENFWKKGGGYE